MHVLLALLSLGLQPAAEDIGLLTGQDLRTVCVPEDPNLTSMCAFYIAGLNEGVIFQAVVSEGDWDPCL